MKVGLIEDDTLCFSAPSCVAEGLPVFHGRHGLRAVSACKRWTWDGQHFLRQYVGISAKEVLTPVYLPED